MNLVALQDGEPSDFSTPDLTRPHPLVSVVPVRLRSFVASDADLLVVLLTAVSILQLLADRQTLTSPPGSGIGFDAAPVGRLMRLYRAGEATDNRVLQVADRFERADARR